jgi:hypothetical protein
LTYTNHHQYIRVNAYDEVSSRSTRTNQL